MLSFAPVALPTAVVGSVVIYFAARLLQAPVAETEVVLDWRVEIPVAAGARVIGRTPADVALAKARDYEVVSVRRDGDYLPANTHIEAGDRLIFRATEAGIAALWGSPLLGLQPHRLYAVSIRSGDENGFLADLEEDGAIQVVAAQTTVSLRRTSMTPGSTCYLAAADPDVLRGVEAIALWQDAASRAPQPRKTWIALSILAVVVITASIGLVPIEFGSVGGALLMVLSGVLTPRAAGRALDWNILFVLAGSVGLGAIVTSSGLADLLAGGVRTLSAGSSLLMVIVFAVITTVLTNLVTNAAAASILTPVAISLAAELAVNPVILLALIGTCISFTFITPFSHQSNLMVMGPMGYTTKEFVRFGVPVLGRGPDHRYRGRCAPEVVRDHSLGDASSSSSATSLPTASTSIRNPSWPCTELTTCRGAAVGIAAASTRLWPRGYSRSLSIPATTVRAVIRPSAASMPPRFRPTSWEFIASVSTT